MSKTKLRTSSKSTPAGETYKSLALGEKNHQWNRSRAVKLRWEQGTWPYSPDEGPETTGENLNKGRLRYIHLVPINSRHFNIAL